MRTRRGFWLNHPWYTDWVLLTAAVLGVIVGVSQVATYYFGAGVISPLAIVDFLFAFVVTTAFWGLVLLLIRWTVRKAAHIPDGAVQPGRTPTKSAVRARTPGGATQGGRTAAAPAVRVRVAGGSVRFTRNSSGRLVTEVSGIPPHAQAAAVRRAKVAAAEWIPARPTKPGRTLEGNRLVEPSG